MASGVWIMYGVLNDQVIITKRGAIQLPPEKWGHPNFWTLGTLLQIAKVLKLRQIWVVNGSGFWKDTEIRKLNRAAALDAEFLTETEKETMPPPSFFAAPGWKVAPGEFQTLNTAWQPSVANSKIQILFPGLSSEDWAFDRERNAMALFNAIDLFVEKCGVLPNFPIRTACNIFEKKGSAPPLLTSDGAEFFKPFLENETTFLELRSLTAKEKKSRAVFAFDKRAMFLSAMSQAFGEAGYRERGAVQIETKKDVQVGLYDCEISFAPGCILANYFDSNGKYTSNYLHLFLDRGAKISVSNSWVWDSPRRLFDGFYKTVSAAKKETSGGGIASVAIVNDAVKSCYVWFVGWLRSLRHANGYAANYFRPDWHALIVSLANANLWRNVLQVYDQTGKLPVGIYHDCLMYAGNDLSDFEGTCLLDNSRYSFEWEMLSKEFSRLVAAGENAAAIDEIGGKQNEK